MIHFRSADFECGQGDGGEGGGDEPETHDDLRLGPAGEVKVVVDGCAAEEAFAAGIFEVADLQDDAEKLDDEDAADDEQENFISGDKCAVAHSGAEGQ